MIVDSISPNSTSLYFSWTPPPAEQRNGIITGYQFRFYNDDLGTDDEVVENITETSITLTSLEIFTVYNVTVAAGTFVGFGPVDTVALRTLNDSKFAFPSRNAAVLIFSPSQLPLLLLL